MIIDFPNTTTGKISKALVNIREEGGAVGLDGAELLGQREAAGIHIGDEDAAGAGGLGHGDGHEADDADAGDEQDEADGELIK
jgi:hypothetical protein